MKERPILFSAPMVRALLDGRKTQTRRVVKPQPDGVLPGTNTPFWKDRGGREAICPYGKRGDRLWVRETWAQPAALDPGPTVYRADYPACVPTGFENVPSIDEITWKPSIHMPRAMSRITLEVTSVRIQRLQDISESDVEAEGTFAGAWEYDNGEGTESARESFQCLWDSLNASRGFGWDFNPWVWVVAFCRI
ncbi:hypothetical protein [Caballeronia glebae]|uniref:hypothetical protein n=1 Tax=Caballeronia glebae TaxID=1777143 RepID=UPI0038B98A67